MHAQRSNSRPETRAPHAPRARYTAAISAGAPTTPFAARGRTDGQKDFIDASASGNVIDIKPAGYAKYTSNPAEYHKYKIGNRIGMSQTDAEQLAGLYRCTANRLVSSGKCTDRPAAGGARAPYPKLRADEPPR